MNRIEARFAELERRREKALVGFVTAGDPTPSESMRIIDTMLQEGTDILELGVPFSDPTADGPVIQRSSERARQNGVSLETVLEMVRTIRRRWVTPIVIFSYYNPILVYGAGRFYKAAVDAGVDGVLVVDLPPEESDEMTSQWPGDELLLIRLVAPTTSPDRMAHIAAQARGFIYLVSMTGVTGSEGLNIREVQATLDSLKTVTAVPICIGFGVSSPEHIRELAPLAEGVVVGSAFERIIESRLKDSDCAQKVGRKVRCLKDATGIQAPVGYP